MVEHSEYDIIIVGAGPAGLCFARSLADSGLRLAIVEPQSRQQLAEPAFDGREIALTHHSVHLMQAMGVWQHIPADQIHMLRDARVMDGDNDVRQFTIHHSEGKASQLGYLVANHLIRQAAYAATQAQQNLSLYAGLRSIAAETNATRAEVQLSDGRVLRGRLLVAADSRFSETRRAVGIGASMEDFGKTMLVCRMRHEGRHEHVAWEWFGSSQTLALLPLNEYESSVVLTLPHAQVQRLMSTDETAFNIELSQRFEQRLGAMQLTSTRHAYPLVGVYPHKFTGTRFALVGDAAVGMHPVTAHGFNFGLLGQDLLSKAILDAHHRGTEISADGLLAQYERRLWRATRPLYLATRTIIRLYTNDSPPARLARKAGLALGARISPSRRMLAAGLTQKGSSLRSTRPVSSALRALVSR